MKGKFITIYGINNIGKSTHCKLLVERLKKAGHKAKFIKYPVYDIEPSGPFLNKALRRRKQMISEAELQMWFVVNRYQFQPKLEKMLSEGYIVVAEDYRGTGIAWGTAKGLDEKWVEEINSKVLPEDLVIWIEGKRNIEAKEDVHVHEQNDELMEKCKEVHGHLARKYGWKKVKLQEKVEDTAELIWKTVLDFL
ncbi:MAG: hypothetical protein V1679_02560 [Candidatus Peregrinibacteria bacterium]